MNLEKLDKVLSTLIFSFGLLVNIFGIVSCYYTYPTINIIRDISYICFISQAVFLISMLVSNKKYSVFSFTSTSILGLSLVPILIWNAPEFLKFLPCTFLIGIAYGISTKNLKFSFIPIINCIIFAVICFQKTSLLCTIFYILNWTCCNLVTTMFSILLKKYGKLLQDSNKKFKKMALRDELTGLYNRHYLQELEGGEEYIPILLDIDFFKDVNDTYGHDEGDTVLQLLSSILLRYSNQNFIVFRYGGEEFLILSKMSEDSTDNVIKELFLDIRRELKISSDKKPLTVSVGIGRKSVISDNTIKRADINLYVSKKNGRNCISKEDVVIFS